MISCFSFFINSKISSEANPLCSRARYEIHFFFTSFFTKSYTFSGDVLDHLTGAYLSIESAITAPALTRGSGTITTFESLNFWGILSFSKGAFAAEIIALEFKRNWEIFLFINPEI